MSQPEVTWTGEWHPFAQRLPMRGEEELRELAESIRETGQINACLMTPEGLGLDGRNRVAACRIAGVEPGWVVVEGHPSMVIAAATDHRRLTPGQRAMQVAMALVDSGKRSNGRFKRGSVPEAPDNTGSRNTWQDAVMRSGVILDWKNDLADEVLLGTIALDAAYQEARQERDRQTVLSEKLAQLPTDLAALVEAGARDIDDALKEAQHRSVVYEVDKARDRDGAPHPSFADRAESGSVTWAEAAALAKNWSRERDESIDRDRRRIRNIVNAWGTVRTFLADPESPYMADVIEGLDAPDAEAIVAILTDLKEHEQ